MNEFALRSRQVLIDGESRPIPATLIIRQGKIAAVQDHTTPAVHVTDLGDLLVCPGIVDTHAHINEPGRTDWEGFQTATRAAAAGGITTVIDMPLNSIPATTTLEALRIKAKTAEGKCSIDYGFWGGVVPGNASELHKMIQAGAMGFKAFLCESGVEEFPMVREADLKEVMPILARAGVPLLVHAELETAPSLKAAADSSRDYQSYLNSRPENWEVEAIRLMIRLARETGCRTHIVHLSAASALDDLREAKKTRLPITSETCPHYLYFEAEKIQAGATHFKCAPPIREHENKENLWAGIQDSSIDFIVSDHSPCTPDLKLRETGDFSKAWGGISGLQFSLSVIWTEMKRRGFSVKDLSTRMSERTAEFAGLSHRKGKIALGLDADFVIWNPEQTFRVEPALTYHKNKLTPYDGAELYGAIHQTYVRGSLVYDQGNFSTESHGKQMIRGES